MPCCEWVGEGSAGHFVKMVHNGIEYGDMQLICEAYDFMTRGLDMDEDEMENIFNDWNHGLLSSYLIEISADIFSTKDTDGKPLLRKILDTAGQKGTGKWTGINALEPGIPLTLIAEAVFSRCLQAGFVQLPFLQALPLGKGMQENHSFRISTMDYTRQKLSRIPRGTC
jgi:6-phosphogluconate dehydrogenase